MGREMMENLKLCPFCGNSPTIRIFRGRDGWRDRYAVICRYDEDGCGAESGLYHYEEEAIEAWNRRQLMETNLECFNRIFKEHKTAEETAIEMIAFRYENNEISEHTNVEAMRKSIIDWLNSPAPKVDK